MKTILKSKFNTDLLWNGSSFGLSALIGVVINSVIVNNYGSGVLGGFNLIYAFYIMASQLTTMGIHLSVLSKLPLTKLYSREFTNIIVSAITAVLAVSFAVTIILYFIAPFVTPLFNSDYMSSNIEKSIIALPLFSLNKVLMNQFNAVRKMIELSILQFTRFAGLLIFVLYCLINDLTSDEIVFTFLFAELLVLLVAIMMKPLKLQKIENRYDIYINFKAHLIYGTKSMFGNLMMDINTRIDVFILGIMTNESIVGIYSLASTVADGVVALAMVIRNNINPIITRIYVWNNIEKRNRMFVNMKNKIYKMTSPVYLLAIISFPLLMWIVKIDDIILVSSLFSIYVSGIVVSAGYLPFQMIFNQAQQAITQTYFMILVFIICIILNVIFINLFDIYGAALAMGLTYIFQSIATRIISKRKLNISF